MVYRAATEWRRRAVAERWVYSSAGEHYLDMVGVTGSIPVTPTISTKALSSLDFKGSATAPGRGPGRMGA